MVPKQWKQANPLRFGTKSVLRVRFTIVAFICSLLQYFRAVFCFAYNHLLFVAKTNKEKDNNNWLFAFDRTNTRQFWTRAKRSNVW
jgi:hypothetical protein